MKSIRRILYPFGLVYSAVASIRNYFFDAGVYASKSYETAVIAVGNISVGGTGKTPQIEYLIRLLLDENLKIATVSRGYKRKSKGMVVANSGHTADDLGDEPFQFYSKFPQVQVVVNANRVEAIDFLEQQTNKPDVILLDDAMQHRKVKAGFYVMLTAFGDFFYDDLVLPAGNLREAKCGAKRADVIVVTKCPSEILETEKKIILDKIKKYAPNAPVYFSKISYDTSIYSANTKESISELGNDFILLAGIAKPLPFFNHLKKDGIESITFADHHNFTPTDIASILQKADGKKIITTEKDYTRLLGKIPSDQLYYLPIQAEFLYDAHLKFNHLIKQYVGF